MNIPCFLQPNKSTHLQKHNKIQTKHIQQELTNQIKTRNHLQPIQASHTNHRNNNGNKHDHQNGKRGNGRAKKCQRGQARVRRRRGGRRRWRDDRRRRRAGKQGGGREGKVKLFCFFLLFYYRVGPEGMFDRGRWIVSCVEVHRVLSWMWDLAFLLVDFK